MQWLVRWDNDGLANERVCMHCVHGVYARAEKAEAERDWWKMKCAEGDGNIERLREALEKIAQMSDDNRARAEARKALR